MPTVKMLHKIKNQIQDLQSTLELFTQDTILPSVEDCKKLQDQLFVLQDNLSIYRYIKGEREISPSFTLHAKVSEKSAGDNPEIKEAAEKDNLKPLDVSNQQPALSGPQSQKEIRTLPPISIGVNDKFRLINELFKQNTTEYNIGMEQLNTLSSMEEARIYLESLKAIYGWDDNSEMVQLLYGLVKKRFH
jgi:hypothetical protein